MAGVMGEQRIVWAKLARERGSQNHGPFHAWTDDGLSVCANGRGSTRARLYRDRRPVRACVACMRKLGGA